MFKVVLTPTPLRTPITLTRKLWQNSCYLQLGRLNNWFYAAITIFAQQFSIYCPKLGEWRSFSPPLGYVSGNSDWWLCGFDLFVAIANP